MDAATNALLDELFESQSANHEDMDISINVDIDLYGPDGQLKQHEEVHNLTPTVGKEKYAERAIMASPSTEGPKYISVGTTNTAPANGDTALAAQDGSRKEATTRSVSGAVGTVAVEFTAGEHTAALVEAGLHSASTTGTLYARAVFSTVNKGAEDTLVVTWKVTFS